MQEALAVRGPCFRRGSHQRFEMLEPEQHRPERRFVVDGVESGREPLANLLTISLAQLGAKVTTTGRKAQLCRRDVPRQRLSFRLWHRVGDRNPVDTAPATAGASGTPTTSAPTAPPPLLSTRTSPRTSPSVQQKCRAPGARTGRVLPIPSCHSVALGCGDWTGELKPWISAGGAAAGGPLVPVLEPWKQ